MNSMLSGIGFKMIQLQGVGGGQEDRRKRLGTWPLLKEGGVCTGSLEDFSIFF